MARPLWRNVGNWAGFGPLRRLIGRRRNAARLDPVAPTEAEWSALEPRAANPVVDVIIPIYGGRVETLRAIHRALAARNTRPCEIVLVDDRAPDPVIGAKLDELQRRGLATVLRNETNRGFVASANRGMALHPDRDVVLLNADTEVFGDWADRLHAAVASADDIATATPWSNAATILSYPAPLRDNHEALEIGPETLDALAAHLPALTEDIPTAIGFCMYIRRRCLDQVGAFDELNFGQGYGEENDFCRRAARLGWRHVAALRVYVHHYGGRSFGAEKEARVARAIETVERLHPNYKRLIADFIRRDPLARHRRNLDAARRGRLRSP
jgi:GT2 family glycosyltransferase